MALKIEFTPEFQRNIKTLAKKYRNIRRDIEPIIEELKKGKILGNRIPKVEISVFKLRARNTDISKGKRSGYRLIYAKTKNNLILLTVYSKTQKVDITQREIRNILNEFRRWSK